MSQNGLGKFYGVGVGPGDPELLTLKAHRILKSVPVVAVPKRAPEDYSFAYSIVDRYVDEEKQKILELIFPMTKDHEFLKPYWEKAAEKVYETLATGEDCAFITEGDPFFYSTFIYLFENITRDHPEVHVEVIPGVSSVHAASTRLGIPLVNADDRLAIVGAVYEKEKLRQILQEFDTVVLMKISSVSEEVIELLEEMNLIEKACFVQKCGTLDEVILRDVRELKRKKLDYMSLLIVRK